MSQRTRNMRRKPLGIIGAAGVSLCGVCLYLAVIDTHTASGTWQIVVTIGTLTKQYPFVVQ